MCGITFFFSFSEINRGHIDKLHACNNDMLYRGPDEQDVWFQNNVALAHVRLSIIGVANGKQPIFNEDNSLVLICNGEIYNYLQLRAELTLKGHVFKTESDSEVIIHLFEEYGEDFCDKLDGMFAFCLYNLKTGNILVARDRAGKKPLYYATTNEGIVFSSELKVIKKYFIHDKFINYAVLEQVQRYSYSISPTDTYIEGIKKAPPGSYSVINKCTSHPHFIRYHKRIIKNTFLGSYQDACIEVKRLFYRAVEKRLQSEVPVAVLLSAGIDSSAIACVAREMSDNVNVISAGYKGDYTVDERAEARKLADERHLIWNEVQLNGNDFIDNLETIFSVLDEPNGDVSMFAQWEIYHFAHSKGFKVLLSGNGGDELFYGYDVHNQYALSLSWLESLEKSFPLKSKYQAIKLFTKQLMNWIFKRDPYLLNKVNLDMEFPVMKDVFDTTGMIITNRREDWHRAKFDFEIDKVYYFLNYAWLTNNCYFLADKLAMANSVEVRCPFADAELMDFVDTLPIEIKFKDGKPKQLLKDSLRDVIPQYVLERRKSGFTPPVTFVQNMVNSYQKKHFAIEPNTFPQLVTDYFASKI